MNLQEITPIMKDNARRIEELLQGVTQESARWRPGPHDWSLVEVINHLYDEEMLDFRVRLELICFHPEAQWLSIDPDGWVAAKDYQSRDFRESVGNFLAERVRSLAWLESLGEVNLEAEGRAPWGMMRAGDMLTAWVAHDLHHMRQIVELLRGLVLDRMAPYSDRYAGGW